LQSFQYTPFANPLALTALIAAVLGIYIWDRRSATGAKSAAALMVTVFVWCTGYMLEFMGVDLETKLFWAKIQYFGITTLPVALFMFSINFSGYKLWRVTPKLAALLIIPILTIILVFTNEAHRLIWPAWTLKVINEQTAILNLEHGSFFWVNFIYAFLLLTTSTILIIQALIRRPKAYRGQISSVLVGVAAPWIGNAISNLANLHIDLTPFSFAITGLAIVWSIYKYHLFEIAPNAYETVINSMRDPVFIMDMRNTIINANPAAQQMLGLPASGVIGHHSSEVFVDQTDIFDIYQHALNIREEITIGSESQKRYYEISILPLTDRLDKILGRAAILHDISDRKRAVNAMAMSRDQALESSRVKSEFLARVSHELRTPLGVIRGYADLLSEPAYGELSQLQTKAVSEIIDSTERISGMVGELLDEARLAAGAVQLVIKSINPAEILEDVKQKLSVLANQKKLELTTELDPDLPEQLVGDPTRIHQMVTNLTSNSIKFTKQGKVGIRFYLHNSIQWAIEVNDTGPGIPEEAHESIFEPFRQADSSIPRIFGGTGLGLSIVKHLTNLMGGEITVESEVGNGSTFTILLPLKVEVSE
jgi:PAS domain S-box-containing protein